MAKAVVTVEAPEEAQLDRAAFTEVVHLKALRVPTARCQELMKKFSGQVIAADHAYTTKLAIW